MSKSNPSNRLKNRLEIEMHSLGIFCRADWLSSTPESIGLLDYEQAVSYHKATHQRNSAVLLVLGDVSEAEVQKAVEASGLRPLTDTAEEIQPYPFTLVEPDARNFAFENASAEPRIIFRKIVTLEQSVDFDFLEVQTAQLSAILNTNLSGGVAGPLRYDNFIARSFELFVHPLDEKTIEIMFFASPDKNVLFNQLRSAFEGTLKVAGNGIPSDTYLRIQSRSKYYWVD